VKVGSLVRRTGITPQEIEDYAELGIGLVVDVERTPPPFTKYFDNGFGPDVVVLWAGLGDLSWEMPAMLEVMT